MRTDSTNVAELAQAEARQFIGERYGRRFPARRSAASTRPSRRGAQEAHEAIRPTSVMRQPDTVKEFLNRDQFRLYQLIWQRFVASQMTPAVYDTLSVEVTGKTSGHEYLLRASGSTVRFPGFLMVYEEAKDEDQSAEEEQEAMPASRPGSRKARAQKLVRLLPEQHFTQPPPRYTEATLVSTLEENGIGRPSTYAPILSTIQQRGYVLREGKRLTPTETGILVNDLIVEHFPEIVDVGFTAQMEDDLDQIADGRARLGRRRSASSTGPLPSRSRRPRQEMPEMNMGPSRLGGPARNAGTTWSSAGAATASSSAAATSPTAATPSLAGKDRRDLPEGRRRDRRAQDPQGPHLLRLRQLPGLRFHLLEAAPAHALPGVRRHAGGGQQELAQCIVCEDPVPARPGDRR